MKLSGKMVEAGQAYSTANKLLLSGLAELCTNQTKDSVITVSSSSMHLKNEEIAASVCPIHARLSAPDAPQRLLSFL